MKIIIQHGGNMGKLWKIRLQKSPRQEKLKSERTFKPFSGIPTWYPKMDFSIPQTGQKNHDPNYRSCLLFSLGNSIMTTEIVDLPINNGDFP